MDSLDQVSPYIYQPLEANHDLYKQTPVRGGYGGGGVKGMQ